MTNGRHGLAVLSLLLLSACGQPRVTSHALRPAGERIDDGGYVAAQQELARFDPGGRISRVEWSEDGRTLRFTRLGERYEFDLHARATSRVADDEGDGPSEPSRRRRRGPGRGRQRMRATSPDGGWIAICRDWNVVLESNGEEAAEEEAEAETIEVTTDGHRKLRYGTASWVYGEELDQRTAMWWSPDSDRLAFYEFDEREVPDHHLLAGQTELHTTVLTEGYPKPGEPNPRASLLVYDLNTREMSRIPTDPGDGDEWYVYQVRFTPDGSGILFNRTNRHQNVLHLVAVDLATGGARVVVQEEQATWQRNRPFVRFLADGRRFIWETERNGVRQYELRDLAGDRIATLTPADHPAISIVRVDEAGGLLYYTGQVPEHPLHGHLFRVRLDGTDRRRLTRDWGHHTVELSPDGRWFISRCEDVSAPPTTALYDTDGRRVAVLAESDPARIEALGHPAPELFSFTTDDDQTELYGVLYRPPGFDPRRRYPLVIDVYGGPGSQAVRPRYRPGHPATVLGVLVARIDNRGTGGRGKTFLGAVYQKLGTVDLEDQAEGVRHLARRPFVDGTRVGIYGHSYGGYLAALAVLKYPEVFHVAVAASAVTDWRNYDTIYTERYMRTPDENPEGYESGSCLTYAHQLEGKLLLMHGMRDDNVHPSNAWQLVEALQKEGKSFEMVMYPNSGHGLARDSSRRRVSFLSRHLGVGPASRR